MHPHLPGKNRATLRLNSILLLLFGLFCLVSYATHTVAGQAAPAPQMTPQPTPDQPPPAKNPACKAVTAITPGECEALVALYENTNGAQWDNQTHWLLPASANSPCDWFGVVCSAGHVTELNLNSNRLRGPLPRAIGQLTHLTHLRLDDNLLRGPMPPALCDLVDTMQAARFEYNQLAVVERHGKGCLGQLQPNWINTQTTAPREIRITAVTTTSLQLTWTPIPYTADGGFYAISYAAGLENNFLLHGQTADKHANQYLLDGLQPGQPYRIRIQTYTPAHANQENEQHSQPAELEAVPQATTTTRVLLLVYFAADNDLSPYIPTILQRLERGSRSNPNVQVVALTDGKGEHNTAVWEIANGITTPTNAVQEKWGVDELDTTDPQVLAWFLQTARHRHPASRTVVSLLGHGAGMMPEVTSSSIQAAAATPPPAIPALPRTVPHTPDDEFDDGAGMSTQDYAAALALATDNGANPFDVVFFDQCFQGNLDVLYEMRNAARVFVASPNYAWLSAPYDRYLAAFTPIASAEEMGNAITHIYEESLNDRDPNNDWYPNAIFWVRGATISTIAGAVNDLAIALQAATNGGAAAVILDAVAQSQFVDTTTCGRQKLTLGPPDELLGIGSFARNLRQNFLGLDQYGMTEATNRVLDALTGVHGLARTGRPYIAPDEIWDYEDTLTMIAPLLRDTESSRRWRSTIYTATAPLNALWASATPTSVVTINTAFANARAGAWDDFLAGWYTTPPTPTVGEACRYTPPVQLTSEVTETLSLSVIVATNLLELTWTPTTNDTATQYWLLVRKPDGFGWVVQESFALTQTAYQVQKPEASGDPYEFMVVAQDETGLIVAQSNQASYGETVSAAGRLYLPVLLR